MKTSKTILNSALALAVGVGSAFVAAPLFHRHGDPHARMQAMWAHDYPSLNGMKNGVDAVVLARVTNTVLGRVLPTTGQDVLPFTYVDLDVEQVIRGTVESQLTLEQTGGRLDERVSYSLDDGGPYGIGDRVLLFLNRQPTTGLYYLAHPKGRFVVEDGTVNAVAEVNPVSAELDGQRLDQALRLLRE